jgi:dephospho-CoA kinase
MLIVGLTGNIAAGKSSVARLFADWGAVVTDADQLVHDLQRPDTPIFEALVARFGDVIVSGEGTLDREALRGIVLHDADALHDLNRLIHPAVAARREVLEAAARRDGAKVIVHDIPLLFEATDPSTFDLIVLVDAPPRVRRARLERDRNISWEEADGLLAWQQPSDLKREASDIIIENDGDHATLERRAREAWNQILEAAAAA